MSATLADVAEKLCALSRESPPYEIQWPESLPEEAWYLSPELMSLAGLPEFDALTQGERQRASFWEAVNFFSLNVNGERSLIEGMVRRMHLGSEGQPDELHSDYLYHFVREETDHLQTFATFCMKYAKKIYPDRTLSFPSERVAGEDDFLFFSRILVFEEIVDALNMAMANDERLHPVAREINRKHHEDEVRHLAFGRMLVAELYEKQAPRWDATARARVREHIAGYLTAVWSVYYNPSAYHDAGLRAPYALARAGLGSVVTRERRRRLTAKCVRYFIDLGVLEEAPAF